MKVRSAIAAGSLCVLLAACSAGGSSSPAASVAASPDPGASDGQPSAAPISGNLVVWDWHYQLETTGPALKQIDDAFLELHPDVTIEHVGQPVERWDELVRAANAARSGPDVAMGLNGLQGVIGYGDQGALASLNDLVDAATFAQFSKGHLDSMSQDYDSANNIYALPFAVQGIVWYYNKDLFRQAGLDPESPPATQADFLSAAEKLKSAGITPIAAGNQDGTFGAFLWANAWSQLATPQDSLDLAAGTLTFTDPKVKEATERALNLVRSGFVPDDFAAIPYFLDGINIFGSGEAAMVFGLVADAANWKVYNEALGAEVVGYFPTPDANFLQTAPATGYGITSYAANPSVAVEYIKFLTGPVGQEINFSVAGNVPTNTAVTLPSDIPANLAAIIDDLATRPTQQFTSALWKPGTVEQFNREFQLVLSGEKSVDEMLAAVAEFYATN